MGILQSMFKCLNFSTNEEIIKILEDKINEQKYLLDLQDYDIKELEGILKEQNEYFSISLR